MAARQMGRMVVQWWHTTRRGTRGGTEQVQCENRVVLVNKLHISLQLST